MASDGKIIIETSLDTKGFEKDVESATGKVANGLGKGTEKAMKQAESSIKNVGKAVNGIDFSNIAKQMNSISKSIENTNAKIELQKNKLGNLKKAFESATDVNKKNKIQEQMLNTEASIIKLENRLNNLNNKKIKLDSAKDAINGLDGEFSSASMSITKSLDNIDKKAKQTGKDIKNNLSNIDIGKGISSIGESISGVGDKLTTRVTLPILGLGAAAAKIGMDFDSGMSRVKAISGATGEEFTKLHDQALQLGADTAFSAKQASEGMENLASAGFSTNEIMEAMPGLLDLAASSGESLASSSDIAASTLRGFGLEASQTAHVADVLAKNASATNAAVADTGEAMKYIAPVAHSMGLSIEEVTAAIGELSNSGIKGSMAGTTLRSALTRLASPSDEAAKAMQKLGFNAFDGQGKLKNLSTIVGEYQKALKGKTEQQKQDYTATIFGQEAMSGMLVLMDGGKQALDDLTNSYKNSDGAAKDMAKTMQDNAGSSIEQMMGSIETAAIKLEEVAAPTIRKIADEIQDMANKFSELSPEMQETIIKTALYAAAAGPVLKTVGGITSGIGGMVSLISKLTPALGGTAIAAEGAAGASGLGALIPALGAAATAAVPFILAAATIGGAGYAIYDTMTKEVVPSVDLFADEVKYTSETVQTEHGAMQKIVATDMTKISDSTKKAVQAYLDMDNGVKSYLQDLYINNSTITSQIVTDSKSKFDSMANNTISGYEKQKNDGISKLEELFSKEKILTAEQQSEILKKTNDYYTNKESKVKDDEAKINKIISDAYSNNRSLTQDELNQIQNLQNDMRENAINALSEQESQAAVILQRMKDYDGRITAEQASEKIKALNDSRDKAIQAANDEYDSRIAIISDMRDNIGSITSDEADKMIDEAKRQRDETVKKAEETRNGAVDKIQDMNSSISSEVDTTTGNILTSWDKLKAWWNSWFPEPKKMEITTETQAAGNAYNNAMNSQPWAQNNPYLQIGEKKYTGTGGGSEGVITKDEHGWEMTTGENELYYLGSGTGILDHGSSVNQMQKEVNSAVDNRFSSVVSKLITNMMAQNQILSKVANNTGQSVQHELKNVQLNEKLANALINQMSSSSGGFTQLQGEIDSANKAKETANNMKTEDNYWVSYYKQWQDSVEANIDSIRDKIDETTDESYKKQLQAQQKALEKQKDSLQKEYEASKDAAEKEIQLAKDTADQQVKIAEEKKDKLTKLADAVSTAIKNQLDQEETSAEDKINNKLTSLDNSYNKKLKALEEESTATTRNDTRQDYSNKIAVLQAKMNNTASYADKRAYDLQIKDLQKQSDKQESEWTTEDKKKTLEEQYNKEKETLEKKLKDTQAYYSKLKETDSINAQTRYIMLNSNQEDLVKLLNSYNPLWQNAGQTLADSLLTGLNSQKQSVTDAVNEMIGIRDMAPPSQYYDAASGKMVGYASGTSSNPVAGFYKTNELGPETATSGDVAYVSKGAAIKNAMQTEQMINSEIARQVASMRASVQAEQANMQALLTSNLTGATNTTIKTEHNQNAPLFHAENVYLQNENDIETITKGIGFYSQKNNK